MGNAERQARWRAKRDALARANPDVAERALLQRAERFEQLSAAERAALADALQAVAMQHWQAMHQFNKLAIKVRGGER